jgi:hypothetical protein
VLVELAGGGDQELAHEIAVHIAFAKPKYLSRDEVPADEVAKERRGSRSSPARRASPSSDPEDRRGPPRGWFKDRVLLEQAYVKDDKQSIAQLLGGATIVRFALVVDRQLSGRPLIPTAAVARWPRVILKLSGEAFAGEATGSTAASSASWP